MFGSYVMMYLRGIMCRPPSAVRTAINSRLWSCPSTMPCPCSGASSGETCGSGLCHCTCDLIGKDDMHIRLVEEEGCDGMGGCRERVDLVCGGVCEGWVVLDVWWDVGSGGAASARSLPTFLTMGDAAAMDAGESSEMSAPVLSCDDGAGESRLGAAAVGVGMAAWCALHAARA